VSTRHASYGDGPAVVLLHGGLGHAGNWGYQVPAILSVGYRAILIDSRGHGRSTRDDRPYSYERAVRASALARTMSGSRGSGESSSGHGRSLRTLRRPMRIRFITDLPRSIDRARARAGRVVSLAGAGVLGLSLASMVRPCQFPDHRPDGWHMRLAVVFPSRPTVAPAALIR